MSKSTPINRLPIENIIEESNDAEESINEVLREIETQNGNNVPINNNVLPLYNQPQNQQQQPPPQMSQQQNNQPFAQPPMMDPQLIEKLLAQQNNSFSFNNLVETFKSELKLVFIIFVVVFIINTDKFKEFADNHFNIIKIPYIKDIISAIVATIAIVLSKKMIN